MQLSLFFHRFTTCFVLLGIVVGCDSATSVSEKFATPVSNINDLPSLTAAVSSIPPTSTVPPQTQTAFSQAVPDATQSVIQTKIARFPSVCRDSYAYPRFSPNGLWLEELCYSENDRDLVLTLSNSERQVLWKLLYQEHIPPMDFVPDGGMLVVHWTSDGRYAYFVSFLGGDGGECFRNGIETGSGLFRVDLQDGQATTVLPPNDTFWWYAFSLSPTDRRLVYGPQARDLRILDIKTGELTSIVSTSNFDEGGGFLWSSDGLKFIYSALTRNSAGEKESYSLHLVNAKSGYEQIILESTKDCFAAISWTEDNILTIEKNFSEALIEFDLNSNSIVSETIITP